MQTQRYYTVTLKYENFDHWLGREVIESWLQFFFNLPNSYGRDLAEKIGHLEIQVYRVDTPEPNGVRWWEKRFTVRTIKKIPHQMKTEQL